MNGVIEIYNAGQAIASTNYWDTAHAARGFVYCSWNAGALRLLIPDAMLSEVEYMRTGRLAIVSRGPLRGTDAIEIMWDDDADAPYALHLTMQMCDRAIPADESGREIVVAAWGRAGKLAQWPGRYRASPILPDLSPWRLLRPEES